VILAGQTKGWRLAVQMALTLAFFGLSAWQMSLVDGVPYWIAAFALVGMGAACGLGPLLLLEGFRRARDNFVAWRLRPYIKRAR